MNLSHIDPPNLSKIVDAYLECALWSSTDDDGNPLDENATRLDIAPEALDIATRDCRMFAQFNAHDIANVDPGSIGHNFWLTRNHHGAGFWDGDYPEAIGERLTASAHAFGETDLYFGDDGMLYLAGGKDWSPAA